MSYTIAVAGKGGTGKTTLCALLMAELLQRDKGPVLAVDADPNSCLGQVLGIDAEAKTVGGIREDALGSINSVHAGMTKEEFLEFHIQSALIEASQFDLITMGRPEGLGCYCYANNLIRKIMDILSGNYPFVLIDNEAGMEHLSRRTTRDVDYLVMVADASKRGLETASRIAALAAELKLKIHRKGVVIGRMPTDIEQDYRSKFTQQGLDFLGSVPYDKTLRQYDMDGVPLINLPVSSSARKAVSAILDNIPMSE